MGAIPNKLTGFQDVETDAAAGARSRPSTAPDAAPRRVDLTQMFDAMGPGRAHRPLHLRPEPAPSEADTAGAQAHQRTGGRGRPRHVPRRHAELADVVPPGSATWCESEGTVSTASAGCSGRAKARTRPPGPRRHRDHPRDRPPPRHDSVEPSAEDPVRAAHPVPDARGDELERRKRSTASSGLAPTTISPARPSWTRDSGGMTR